VVQRIRAPVRLAEPDAIPSGNYLLRGLGFVIASIFLVVVGAGIALTDQSRSMERFSVAVELQDLLHRARLSELIYTRDDTVKSADDTRSTTAAFLARAAESLPLTEARARLTAFDAPTNSSARTGLYMELPSTADILLDKQDGSDNLSVNAAKPVYVTDLEAADEAVLLFRERVVASSCPGKATVAHIHLVLVPAGIHTGIEARPGEDRRGGVGLRGRSRLA
jgi:hypothetical protein